MKYRIILDGEVESALCENDKVKSVLQNIQILFATQKGSIPMYRDFGVNWDFWDKPTPVAQALMVSRTKEALEEYEPRAEFLGMEFRYDETTQKIIPVLEVEMDEQIY